MTSYIKIRNPDCHQYPVILSFPHSGTYLPDTVRAKLVDGLILPNTDWYLPELYSGILQLPVTAIINEASRYVIDVNRGLTQSGDSYRDNLVFTTTTQDDVMYRELPTGEEIQQRIRDYYQPYHQALRNAVAEKRKRFSRVYVLDIHSFGLDFGAQMILGNCHGASCYQETMGYFTEAFRSQGLTVKQNEVYPGGYITKAYGAPEAGVEALQIELWYASYIENRYFGKEEAPGIDRELFQGMQDKLQAVFQPWLERIQKSAG